MSGLTIGLLSLDPVNLEILKKSGDETSKKYAKGIAPLIKRHHLLLATLLMANAVAMESLPIFLDRLVNPFFAILISVTAVLPFLRFLVFVDFFGSCLVLLRCRLFDFIFFVSFRT